MSKLIAGSSMLLERLAKLVQMSKVLKKKTKNNSGTCFLRNLGKEHLLAATYSEYVLDKVFKNSIEKLYPKHSMVEPFRFD